MSTTLYRTHGHRGRRQQRFPGSADALRRATGVTFANLWLMQDASTPATDSIGAISLAAGATPTFATASSYPRLCVSLDDGTGDRVESADASFDYDNVTSLGILQHAWIGAVPGANRELFGKRVGSAGYDLIYTTAGSLSWFVGDGTDTVTATIASNHASTHTTAWADVDRNAGTTGLSSQLGNQTGSLASIDSLTNAGNFRCGAVTSTAPTALIHLFAHATGSNAEGHTRAEIIRRFHRGLG